MVAQLLAKGQLAYLSRGGVRDLCRGSRAEWTLERRMGAALHAASPPAQRASRQAQRQCSAGGSTKPALLPTLHKHDIIWHPPCTDLTGHNGSAVKCKTSSRLHGSQAGSGTRKQCAPLPAAWARRQAPHVLATVCCLTQQDHSSQRAILPSKYPSSSSRVGLCTQGGWPKLVFGVLNSQAALGCCGEAG